MARATAAAASAFTCSGVMRSFFSMWIFEVAMNTWMRGRVGVPHGFPRAVDVLEAGARQPGDDRAAHRLGDRLDRLEVAVGRDREAGLDHVDAEARELLGDLELLGDVERDAGRLLAVSQGRVEDLTVSISFSLGWVLRSSRGEG